MNLQTRLELQGAVQQWIDSFMQQYNITPSMMEDALTKALCNLKDKVILEFLTAAQAQQIQEEESNGGDTSSGDADIEDTIR